MIENNKFNIEENVLPAKDENIEDGFPVSSERINLINGIYKTDDYLKSCIEGILFISETTVSIGEISSTLEITERKTEKILNELEREYLDKNRGFILRKVAGGYRLYSNPAISDILKVFVKSNIRTYISQAALETIAIVCYRQPVTRTQIAEIRGVRTDSVILTLVDKGLIKEAGRLKEPGNPILYKTSEKLLEIMGINSIKDLPLLQNFEDKKSEDKNNGEES
ncbi:MAG: SMC-Scp complex subunit ScpB [Actinomycetia bacterium]|nr:SMC-Scp complex subunit ScpB [Actinomycetota bacterium]MCG2788647.1 SMC-Scp complex subunit ScpB [Actinomycetes bacterium]